MEISELKTIIDYRLSENCYNMALYYENLIKNTLPGEKKDMMTDFVNLVKNLSKQMKEYQTGYQYLLYDNTRLEGTNHSLKIEKKKLELDLKFQKEKTDKLNNQLKEIFN